MQASHRALAEWVAQACEGQCCGYIRTCSARVEKAHMHTLNAFLLQLYTMGRVF